MAKMKDKSDEGWKKHVRAQQCMLDDDVFYLFILHGGNVSGRQDYYGYKTKTFRNIFMYAEPHTSLYTEQLQSTNFMNIRHSLYSKPDSNGTNFKTIFIPPLIYTLGDHPLLNPNIGLYKFISNSDPVKLIGYDELKILFKQNNNNNTITMNDMEGYVLNDIKNNHHQSAKPSLGVFSCQVPMYQHPDGLTPQLPRLIEGVPEKKFLEDDFFFDTLAGNLEIQQSLSYAATITILTQLPPNNWTALAKQQTRGCGLNVLAYLGLVEQNEARQQVCALNHYGTSIFTLYDHYYDKFKKSIKCIDDTTIPFFIIRTRIYDAVSLMVEVLSEHQQKETVYGYAIMFKMYQTKQSRIGHSVLLLKDGQDNTFFVDPQKSIIAEVPQLTTIDIVTYLENVYEGFPELELCFTVRENVIEADGKPYLGFPGTRKARPMNDPRGLPMAIVNRDKTIQLRGRETEVTYKNGGKNKKRSKRKRKTKSQIKYKPKRTTKKKYQRGGKVSSNELLAQKEAEEIFLKNAANDNECIDINDTMDAEVMRNWNL